MTETATIEIIFKFVTTIKVLFYFHTTSYCTVVKKNKKILCPNFRSDSHTFVAFPVATAGFSKNIPVSVNCLRTFILHKDIFSVKSRLFSTVLITLSSLGSARLMDI
jgi:hypothetical protein